MHSIHPLCGSFFFSQFLTHLVNFPAAVSWPRIMCLSPLSCNIYVELPFLFQQAILFWNPINKHSRTFSKIRFPSMILHLASRATSHLPRAERIIGEHHQEHGGELANVLFTDYKIKVKIRWAPRKNRRRRCKSERKEYLNPCQYKKIKATACTQGPPKHQAVDNLHHLAEEPFRIRR